MNGPALTVCLVIAYVAFELAGPWLIRRLAGFLASFEDRTYEQARCEKYRAYTTDFDAVVQTGADLGRVLGPMAITYRRESNEIWHRFETGLMGFRLRLRTAAAEIGVGIRAAIPPDRREDIVVALLLDHSGSMRGDKILFSAAALQVAEEFLVSLGIRIELLGFTTSRWKGGRSRERWLDRERPANPGRLNDLLHIVYRGADDAGLSDPSVFRSMLRLDLLKENVDGEAIEWAEARLLARPEPRTLLIVISDGAPCDDSTLTQNPPDYLMTHLRKVICGIEARGFIEAGTVSLGQVDYGGNFSRSAWAETADEVGYVLLDFIGEMLLAREYDDGPPAAA